MLTDADLMLFSFMVCRYFLFTPSVRLLRHEIDSTYLNYYIVPHNTMNELRTTQASNVIFLSISSRLFLQLLLTVLGFKWTYDMAVKMRTKNKSAIAEKKKME